jgi:hypothetical protein
MSELKSHLQIWGTDFPVGSEWDAGATPAHVAHLSRRPLDHA